MSTAAGRRAMVATARRNVDGWSNGSVELGVATGDLALIVKAGLRAPDAVEIEGIFHYIVIVVRVVACLVNVPVGSIE